MFWVKIYSLVDETSLYHAEFCALCIIKIVYKSLIRQNQTCELHLDSHICGQIWENLPSTHLVILWEIPFQNQIQTHWL